MTAHGFSVDPHSLRAARDVVASVHQTISTDDDPGLELSPAQTGSEGLTAALRAFDETFADAATLANTAARDAGEALDAFARSTIATDQHISERITDAGSGLQ